MTRPVGSAVPNLCGPLRAFVQSVKPHESRAVEFHTSWGGDFKDSSDAGTVWAKRCLHFDYEPAKAVCAYLL
jgi:hypothetical protein